MLTFQGEIKLPQKRKFIVSSVINRAIDPISLSKNVTRRACEVGFSPHKSYFIRTASGDKYTITPKDLCEIWNTGLDISRRVLMVTNRLCPGSGEGIILNRLYANNDCMIHYKHIPVNIFMDNIYASKKYGKTYCGYSCVQIYASEFGWVCADLMRSDK